VSVERVSFRSQRESGPVTRAATRVLMTLAV
jgi:hypothetical protein